MTLHRKLLITSFLREAPYDDVLHEACPDYVPESIRQKREHEEAMRVSCFCSGRRFGGALCCPIVTQDTVTVLTWVLSDHPA
jgi:hypothetical protein